ncbi:MAG: ABC transporter substrate-binding protein [Candidatus Limnocylindrales bacterium]|jgi:polar amino acid transport system substrate-binding protein
MTRGSPRILWLPLLAALIAACSSAVATPTVAPTPTAAPTAAPTAQVTIAPTATPNPCTKANLTTLTPGKLTIGTDNPAYPPYFEPPASGNAPAPWELGDPTNGQGFESAVAYAVAAKLGYSTADVGWTVVPFNNSFAPGPKPFDFYLAQVSYTADRAQAVDMSDGYYFVNQSIVALKSDPIVNAKTIADLKKYKFGAQVGTTAYDTINNVIAPTTTTSVYNTNDDAISAMKAKQIDGLVVDLPTAFIITTSGELANSVIVGQFPAAAGADAEHFSIVLAKGSSLTACVNGALAALKADGSLDQITKTWLSDTASAPVISQ